LVHISPSIPKEAQQLQPEIQQAYDKAEEKADAIHVPERLHRPHAIIAAWLNDHEERRRAARLERDPWFRDSNTPKPFTDQDRRRHRILNAMFKELERQGYRVEEKERKLFVVVASEQVEIELREKFKQVRRPLTAEEKRWAYSSKSGTKQELQPTGFLVFSIKSYFRGTLRREWLEKESSLMEELLSQIVPTIIAAGHLVAELAREREEDARRFAIQQQQAEEQRRAHQLEQNRWRRLVDISQTWHDAEIVREFIAGLRTLGDHQQVVGDKPISEWIEWAEKALLAADPLIMGPARVFSDIANITPWSYRD
jgi:hypothetical protein